MTTFTIDTENNITAWDARPAKTAGLEVFTSDDELATLAADWPGARLVEIWNSLTGVVPVKKFTSRSLAISRIWKQIQHLAPAPAPRGEKKAKAQAGVEEAPAARDGSKKAQVLELLRRPEGASLNEIMTATGWQAHTVRGFMAGALKKAGIAVESFRGEDKVRTYRVDS